MESANVETQSQIIIPTETVTGTNNNRLDVEYSSTQNIPLEQLALFNDLYAKLYSGNAFLLQSNLPPIPNLYLYNPFWAPFPPNYPPPTFPAYYFDPNQNSTTTVPSQCNAEPSFTEKVIRERVKLPFGPEGANIYISHLPKFVDDDYLRSLFEPYGRVLSTKVNIDNRTGESKGIGFVSYDSREAAQRAIGAMNGHHIDNKRLRVQLKRSKEHNATPPKTDNEGH
ncbi:hypothetical protein ACTXT7_007377 [Hymenolepis weldensis]